MGEWDGIVKERTIWQVRWALEGCCHVDVSVESSESSESRVVSAITTKKAMHQILS